MAKTDKNLRDIDVIASVMSGYRKAHAVMLDESVSEMIEKRRGTHLRGDYIEACVIYVESLYGPAVRSIRDLFVTPGQAAASDHVETLAETVERMR